MASRTDAPPIKFIGAVKDEWTMYSDDAADYSLGPPIGFGASSVVHQAIFHSKSENGKIITDLPCALKVLDLDKLPPSSLRLLTRETQLMSLSKHPNVLRVRGSWMMGHKLYIAMRLMNKGSVADVMKYSFIDGIEEEAIKCVLEQALRGLNYLHVNGFIHRDIKAANFLIDEDGTVLLGDLGVAVSLSDEEDAGNNRMMGSVRKGLGQDGPMMFGAAAGAAATVKKEKDLRRGKRKSFVGTPCWMAPEVISQQHYDSSADIWSLGITALELCRGRAPGSRERDLKRVLLSTVQNAPPTLDREGGRYKYSRALKDMIELCLVKDPSKRPTAEQLLEHPFFKGTKKKSYLVNTLLANLPPLSERQERRLLNSNHHGGKQKHHPLALGSPSLTTIGTSHSWEWTWPNLGSPRSTLIRRESSTPPGSLQGHTSQAHGGGTAQLASSSSTSVASLHDKHPIRPAGSSGSLSHMHGAVADGRLVSTSQQQQHASHPKASSFGLPMDMSVFEMDDEEDSMSPLVMNAGEQAIEAGAEPRGRRGSDKHFGRYLYENPHDAADVDQTPKLMPECSSSPTELLIQPPELHTGSQSSSTGPSTPATPSSSHPPSDPTPPPSNPVSPKFHSLGSPAASPKLLPEPPSSNMQGLLLRTLSREASSASAGTMPNSKSKTRGLWQKMKGATPSSMMMMRGSSGTDAKIKDKGRRSSFGALLERTASRGSRK